MVSSEGVALIIVCVLFVVIVIIITVIATQRCRMSVVSLEKETAVVDHSTEQSENGSRWTVSDRVPDVYIPAKVGKRDRRRKPQLRTCERSTQTDEEMKESQSWFIRDETTLSAGQAVNIEEVNLEDGERNGVANVKHEDCFLSTKKEGNDASENDDHREMTGNTYDMCRQYRDVKRDKPSGEGMFDNTAFVEDPSSNSSKCIRKQFPESQEKHCFRPENNTVRRFLPTANICRKYSVKPSLAKYIEPPPRLAGLNLAVYAKKQSRGVNENSLVFRIWKERCYGRKVREKSLHRKHVELCERSKKKKRRGNNESGIRDKGKRKISRREAPRKALTELLLSMREMSKPRSQKKPKRSDNKNTSKKRFTNRLPLYT